MRLVDQDAVVVLILQKLLGISLVRPADRGLEPPRRRERILRIEGQLVQVDSLDEERHVGLGRLGYETCAPA